MIYFLGILTGLFGPLILWALAYSVYWAFSRTGRWHHCILEDYSTPESATNLGRVIGWRWHKITRVPNAEHQAAIARYRQSRRPR